MTNKMATLKTKIVTDKTINGKWIDMNNRQEYHINIYFQKLCMLQY